jgi:glycosyltransferase involved in cell wall biosynthesis
MGQRPKPDQASLKRTDAPLEGASPIASAPRNSGISFCIITHGRRPEKLRREIESIRALDIPNYEILVGGDISFELPAGVVFVPIRAAARAGRLGEMRNRLAERAVYDHLVIADDDLLFHPGFYQGLIAFGEDYEVMCVRVLNPDGTRFWDWATQGGPRGHKLLDYSETDPCCYVTGGLCIMKSDVAARVKWSEQLVFYGGEDLDFSRRLRAEQVVPRFNPRCVVTHDDSRYTQIGDVVLRSGHRPRQEPNPRIEGVLSAQAPGTSPCIRQAPAPVNVLYEASCFGAPPGRSVTRTGIFRVAENVALALSATGFCELKFCLLENFQIRESVEQYLERTPLLSQSPVVMNRLASAIGVSEAELRKKSSLARGRSAKSDKLALEFLRFCRRRIARVGGTVPTREMRWAQVMHIPFHVQTPVQWWNRQLLIFQMIHDLIPVRFPELFADQGARKFLLKTLATEHPRTWFICNSESTRADLCNFAPQVDPQRVLTVPLAAGPDFRPCNDSGTIRSVLERYKVPASPFFLSVCTLEPRKNLSHTIRCFGRLLQEQKWKDVNLVLVGGKGWLYKEIFEEVSRQAGLSERVIFTGFVEDDDLSAFYSAALGFVCMSLYEGFGLPVLEAMQCGTPVIASNVSSLPEVTGDAALLLPPRDADGLCEAMISLYENSALRNELRNKGLERAKLFSWDRCARETVEGYRKALRSSGG